MRMQKKIISLIICISILLMCCTGVTAADSAAAGDSREFLTALGIINDDLQGTVSLNDAAEMLIKISGEAVLENPVEQAKNLGLIPQNSRNTITAVEFAEGLLTVLGYKMYISKSGAAIAEMAENAGLMKGVYIKPYDALKSDAAVEMLKNTLFASPMIMKSADSFELGKNTYLEDKLEISVIEGIVTGNSKTGLYGSGENEGRILIDNISYKSQKDYDRYLGYAVEAYADSDSEIVCVVPQKRNETVNISGAEIDNVSDNGIVYERDGKRSSIKYEESIPCIQNGRYRGPLAKDEFEYSSNRYYADTSYLFIDNDGDGIADVCIANQYRYFRIEDISFEYKYAVDKFSGNILCFSDKDNFYFASGEKTAAASVTPDSILAIACTDEDITELCSENSDRDGFDIYIISEEYGNTVNSFTEEEEGRYEMVLGGKRYKVNANYGITPQKVDSDNLIFRTINVYIDMLGKVIAYEITNTDGLAYITRIVEDADTDSYFMHFYTSSGKHEKLNISRKVRAVDPTPTVTAGNISSVCREYAVLPQSVSIKSVLKGFDDAPVSDIKGYELLKYNIPNLTGQLVRLGCNEDGEVSKIYLPRQLCFGEKGKDDEFNIVTYEVVLDRLNQIQGYETATKLANPQARRNLIMDTYRIGNSPFTYFIPKELADKENFKYTQVSTKDASYVNVDSAYTTNLFLSESNGSYEESMQQVEVHNRPCIVKKVLKTLDEYGDPVLNIEVYYENADKTLWTDKFDLRSVNDASTFTGAALSKPIAADDLSFGDIIQVNESGGKINAFRLLVDASDDLENGNYMAYNNDTTTYAYYTEDTFSGSKTFFTTAEYRCGLAKVMEYNNAYMRTKVNNSGGKELNFWPASFSFRVMIDVDNKTITPVGNYLMSNGKIKAAFYYFLWGADRIFYMYK